ncbi:MAG: DNA-directed DNA polymerase I [Asgard group archaeon]|nr:DNA-directed DNA polymerase I [Asgard group archaeon]
MKQAKGTIDNNENTGAENNLDTFFHANSKIEGKNNEVKNKEAPPNNRKDFEEISNGSNQTKTATLEEHLQKEKGNEYIFLAPEDLPPSYLIDVKYDGKAELAYLKLFNPEDGKVYRWYDNTNHLPYLITTMKKTDIENLLQNEKEFVGCEVTKKHNLLSNKDLTLTKVLATNPLAIGGKEDSYRERITPSFEANIRYHLNYIYDKQLIPGLYYEIENGNLKRVEPKIPGEVKKGITSIFQEQKQEILKLVEQYMPLFFAPIPDIKRCSVDIELHSEKDKIPSPHSAEEEVISVGISDNQGETIVYVLNKEKKPLDKRKTQRKFMEFDNEKELLETVFRKLSEYPIVITFNGDNFDFLYLDNRAKKLEIDGKLIPFVRTRTQDVYLTNGAHIDLYRFFRQPAMRIYAFGGAYDRVTLDELGKTLLGKEKLKLEKFIWDLDLEELIEYNARDSEITLELTTFNNNQAIELIFMLSRITKMPIDDFTRSSVSIWIQNWMYNEHRLRNYLIPRQEDILHLKGGTSTEAIIKGKKYQGAIVIDPQVGIWWDVHVLDFASLYPSLIKTRNLSYETINCSHAECKRNRIPETNHWICNQHVGISSMLIGFIRDIRVYWFKDRAKDQKLSESERNQSDVIQSSLKVLLNASYGVFGSDNFALYCPPVAESTAALAREAISKTKQYCEEKLGLKVLYGDTDSIFVLQPTMDNIDELERWSMDTFQIELSTDYVFRYCGLSDRKKNYFGITTKGYPIVKGLMGKKKNTPELAKRPFEDALDILSKVQNSEELEEAKKRIIKIIQRQNQKISKKEFNLEDLAIRVTLSKKLNKYDSWTQPLQAAVQLILAFPDGEKPTEGSLISFIKTKSFKIQTQSIQLSDKISGSNECSVKPIQLAKKTDVDIPKVKELLMSTLIQLLDTIGISWEESIEGQKSLDSWFS